MDFLLQNQASLLFLLGVAMLTVILMRRWSRYFKRQKAAQRKPQNSALPSALREADSRQPLLDAPPEILRWQVEMHETARELKAELDTKIAILQRLTIDARRETKRLEEVLKEAERANV